MRLYAAIVLFENNEECVKRTIFSILNTSLDVKLYLIDNSNSANLQNLKKLDDRIEYIHTAKNIGFGSAHNIALKKSIENMADYHLVLNPDVYFNSEILLDLVDFMDKNKDVSNIIPKVLYPDGSLQYSCKLLPTPLNLVARRFLPKKISEKLNNTYELRESGYDKIMNIPFLSGCFMFLRVEHLKEIGIFDENIFMYMEDLDLNRRLHKKYRTIYYPFASITHDYARESYKNKKLLKLHIISAIYYFNKYGWFFDCFRHEVNKKILKHIKSMSK